MEVTPMPPETEALPVQPVVTRVVRLKPQQADYLRHLAQAKERADDRFQVALEAIASGLPDGRVTEVDLTPGKATLTITLPPEPA